MTSASSVVSLTPVKFRIYKNTDLAVSESASVCGRFPQAVGKFHRGRSDGAHAKGIDLDVTLFDAADTYGNGLSEELIAKAFPNQRDEIVIADLAAETD